MRQYISWGMVWAIGLWGACGGGKSASPSVRLADSPKTGSSSPTDTLRSLWAQNPPPYLTLLKQCEDCGSLSLRLYDMKRQDTLYWHRYQLWLYFPDADTTSRLLSDWVRVPKVYYDAHKANLGLELYALLPDSSEVWQPTPVLLLLANHPDFGTWRYNAHGQKYWLYDEHYQHLSQELQHQGAAPLLLHDEVLEYQQQYRNKQAYHGISTGGKPRYGTEGDFTFVRSPYYQRESLAAQALAAQQMARTKAAKPKPPAKGSKVLTTPSPTTAPTKNKPNIHKPPKPSGSQKPAPIPKKKDVAKPPKNPQ